jgi:predicted nucleic acid-binding Zn finger protein
MLVNVAYEQRTSILNSFNSSAMDFAANISRLPVAFHGRVRDPLLMRQMMIALHEVIIGDYRVNQRAFTLDPVITVHPDEVFFEAFSSDESAYVRMSANLEAFEIEGSVQYGTTNIDFTPQLRDAMSDLRSSRPTHFTVGAGGFAAETKVASMQKVRYEQKVDLPDSWVKGFLQVQSALAAKPYTFDMRPVDLISVIHYFLDNRAPRPPRGMRFEFTPNEAIAIVLEPWEQRFYLKDTSYTGYQRVIRTWGRQRLELLLGILPFADKVTVSLLGRGLPHFYICHCGDYTFTLVLSGWVRNDWSATSALDLLAPQTPITGEDVAKVYNHLAQELKAKKSEVEAHTLLESAKAEAALFSLCRDGRAIYDPTSRRYRSRELFAEKLNFDTILAPNPRITVARGIVDEGRVTVHSVQPSDTRRGEIKILAEVDKENVLVAVDNDSRVRFAQCTCEFFHEHIMNLGPCEHILAARFAAEPQLSQVVLQQ